MPRGAPKEPRTCKRCWQPYLPACGHQKYCPSCQVPASRERKRLTSRIYYRSHTEQCIQETKRYQQRNREHYLRSRREYEAGKIKKVIPLVLGHYSGGTFACACCGETKRDFLTIDHVNGNGNKTCKMLGIPRGGSELYRWLVRNRFPAGYGVLCANCNMSKGKHGVCVHKQTGRAKSSSTDAENWSGLV